LVIFIIVTITPLGYRGLLSPLIMVFRKLLIRKPHHS